MGIKILRIAMLLMLLTALFAFAGAEELFTDEDGFQWVITGEETAQIMGINRDVTGDLDIPWGVYDSDENWYEVTSIAEGAFAGCNMETLYIGDNITEIGDEAFKGCENLLEVSFMANVDWIPNSCFEGCTALEGVYFGTELNGICARAFYGCSSLIGLELTSDVYISDCVPYIATSAFENCTGLEYVHLYNYWGEIEERAFAGCTSLIDVEFDETDLWGESVFAGCTALSNVLIPNNMFEKFPESAFDGCDNVTLYVLSGSNTELAAEEYGIPYETIDLVDEETGLIYQIDEGMGHAVILGCTDSVSGKVTIPSELDGYEVCEIAFNAFIWEENITEIVIPETVISIGGGAFANSSVTSVQMPPYVEDAGTGMFAYCNNLTRVVCPYEMIEMGRDMFRGCTSLTEVDMPELVQIIHPYAFADCTSLEELYLPPTLIDIYESAFSDCESLTLQVYSNTEGHWFAKEYEFPYELLDKTDSATGLVYGLHDGEVMIIGYNGEDCSNLVIPTEIEGYPVTSIGSNAFSGMPVASVVLPEGLTYIDYGAFSETLLTSVVLPSTLEDMQGAVFSSCELLTDVTLSGNMEWLPYCTFEYCTSLKEITIPEGVIFVDEMAFTGCTALEKIYLPVSVDEICDSALPENDNLVLYLWKDSYAEDFAKENGYNYEIVGQAPADASEYLTYEISEDGEATITGIDETFSGELVIPDEIDDMIVGAIGESAFAGNTAITKVVVPEYCYWIGLNAFKGCTNLTEVMLPSDLLRIDGNAFLACTGLTSVKLPETMVRLGGSVFADCTSLAEINLPLGITHLYDNLFYNCTSLKEITVPEGVTNIGLEVFAHCDALEKVVIPASVASIGIDAFDVSPNVVLYVNANSKALEYAQNYGLDYVIVDGEQTTPLEHFTFEFDGNTMAMKVTDFDSDYTGAVVIPDSYDDSMVSTIGANAFADCTGITEVTIPAYLYIIEANAFNNCTALEKVTFYSMEATIDDSAFAGCSSALTFYAYPYSDAAKYAEVRGINIVYLEREDEEGEGGGSEGYEEFEENGFTYILNYTPANEYSDQYIPGAMITGYNGTIDGELVIPATIGGEEVAGVFETAFRNREDITSVTIPDSVNYVLMCAFEGCPNLKTIDVQAKYIQFGAFRKCTALESADISNAKEIHNSAFSGCTALKTVSLGFCGAEEYGYIGSYAFESCSALETVVLPEKSEWYSINEYAFAGCTSLKSANFYELSEISDCAFYNCSSLESFHLSRLVYWIGEDAFYGCDKLTLQLYSGTEGLEYALNNNVPFVLLDVLDEASGLRYVIEDGQAILLSCEMPEQRAVTVPAELGGYPVYYIGRDVFMGESNLTSITISEGITEIESSAFASCGNLTSVYLPDSMANRLPSFLFSYCRSLTDVRLPEGNTMIPMGFFSNCGFTEFTVPDGVTSIGDCVFEMCTSLTKLTIPASVESIGWDLFYGVGATPTICVVEGSYAHTWAQNQGYTVEFIVTEDPNATPASNFEYTVSDEGATITGFNSEYEDDIVIPATLGGKPVVAIGARAFQGYYGGDSIIIPATVTSVGECAFWDSSLYMATFLGSECTIGYDLFDSPEWSFIIAPKDSDPIAYAIENGIPYGYPTDEPENGFEYLTSGDYSYVTGYDGTPSGDLVIPETLGGKPVRIIFTNAFKGCTEITSVYIPDCVVDMYESAFEGCTGLKSVRFPNGAMEMSDRVFYGCTSLEEVDLTNTQSEIYDYSFYGCTSLKTVKMNIGCDDGGRAYSVYDSAFEGCTALEEVIFPENADWADFGTRAFANCVNLVAFDADNNAEIYGYYDEAFLNCAKLEFLDIQFNFWALGEDVFKGCDSLTLKVYYNSVAMEYAVENNIPYILKDKLTDDGLYYFIDRGEATITGAPAFEGDALVIPATIEGYSVSTIGESAFEGMSIKTVVMPSCIDDVRYYAFADCTELTEITLAPAYYDGYCFSGCTSLKSATFPEGTYEGIWEGMFENCTALETVHVPTSVRHIGGYAFYGCTSLKEVTGCTSLDSIGESAFYGCSSLTGMFLPESLNDFNSDTFSGCDNLTVQVIEGSSAHILCDSYKVAYEFVDTSVENGIVYYIVDGFAYIKGYTDDLPEDVVIPSTLANCAVKSIGERAFENAPVKSITIEEGVDTIGDSAFIGCTAESISLPESLTSLGECAFASCASLTEVNIPAGINALSMELFQGCISLKEIVIPDGITDIHWGAFYDCEGLTSVSLPDSMEWIGIAAFYGCSSLETIDLPAGITSIEDELFHHCISLKEIVIPDGVESIWYDAFKNCPALVKVVIPESVDNILDNPFEDSASVVLHVYEGSYAHEWAVENGMSFELIKVVEATDFTGVPEMIYLPAGVSFTVKLGALPEGAEMPEVSYRTPDETVVSVTADGVITTVAKGNTAVSISGGGVTKLLNISVDDMDVMTLPKAMKIIDEEAFADSASIRILDLRASEGVEIAKNAFSGNFKLRAVLLPVNAVIDSAAFTESEMTVFLCATDAQYQQMTALGYDAVMLK